MIWDHRNVLFNFQETNSLFERAELTRSKTATAVLVTSDEQWRYYTDVDKFCKCNM
jgi:hypothetical protein